MTKLPLTSSESDLHRHIRAASSQLPSWVTVKPGDDMAAVNMDGTTMMVAADQMIEGRHFKAGTSWREVGRKAIARNLSDVAAMAGSPLAAVATVAAPPGWDCAVELFDSMHRAALEWGCPLVGGDYGTSTVAGSPLVISVAILARPGARMIRRSDGVAGDILVVTGELGGSLHSDGRGHHLDFVPRIAEATELLKLLGDGLHAMIDLSDGIARDSARLAEMSDLQAVVNLGALPCREGCTWMNAVGDGEDYELLASVERAAWERCSTSGIVKLDGGTMLTAVGELRSRAVGAPHSVGCQPDGTCVSLEGLGFEHR